MVFVLPESLEDLLWSIPVWTQYFENRLVADLSIVPFWKRYFSVSPNTDRPFQPILVSKIPSTNELMSACWHGVKIVEDIGQVKDSADLIFEFDIKKAHELTKPVEKHIVESFGILLGVMPPMIFPPILPTLVLEDPGSIVVIERNILDEQRPTWRWKDEEKFCEMGTANGAKLTRLSGSTSFEEIRSAISLASIVVGVRGAGTLVGASLGKIVLELHPTDYEGNYWASKLEDPGYKMIYGDLDDMTAEWVWETLQAQVNELADQKRRDEWNISHGTDSQSLDISEGQPLLEEK